MRLAFRLAAVGTALTIPGLAGAGDPRLDLTLRPSAPVVLDSGGRRDALFTIDAYNPGDRRVRVERVRVTYFEGERAVGKLDPATEIFTDAKLLSDPRVEPSGHDLWANLCVAPPTAKTDRVRFDLDLVEREGLHKIRATRRLDVPLHAPTSFPVLSLPVTGTWRVTQGHTCGTNHRTGKLGGEFAWDLAAVSVSGGTGGPGFDASHRNEESATWGRSVAAPLRGTIVSTVDGIEDNDAQRDYPRRSLVESARAPRWIFGNHVVLDGGHGAFVLIAHLRKNTIVVKPGDTVREGDPIGQAGNSGNTILPHLHVQVMDRADPADPDVSGVPAVFSDFLEVSATGNEKQGDAIYRRVAAGDPPEGSFLYNPPAAAPRAP